jgi:hypothetical protein
LQRITDLETEEIQKLMEKMKLTEKQRIFAFNKIKNFKERGSGNLYLIYVKNVLTVTTFHDEISAAVALNYLLKDSIGKVEKLFCRFF